MKACGKQRRVGAHMYIAIKALCLSTDDGQRGKSAGGADGTGVMIGRSPNCYASNAITHINNKFIETYHLTYTTMYNVLCIYVTENVDDS